MTDTVAKIMAEALVRRETGNVILRTERYDDNEKLRWTFAVDGQDRVTLWLYKDQVEDVIRCLVTQFSQMR